MIPSQHHEAVETVPPDDWLEMSDAELIERSRRLSELDDRPAEAAAGVASRRDRARKVSDDAAAPNDSQLGSAFQLAQSLTAFDRMRLIAKLWTTLTPRQQARLVSIQFDGSGGPIGSLSRLNHDPIVRAIWRFLLDPTNTSGLYSAPRRFDLATIFVVISAYSMLFAGLSLVDRVFDLEFQPELTIIAGALVTAVAVAQAWYFGAANPRGVSVIAGAISYTILCFIFAPFAITIPGFFVMVVINGIFGGAVFGYIAGVFVGGMFLVADVLREKIDNDGLQETIAPEQNQSRASEDATGNGNSEH